MKTTPRKKTPVAEFAILTWTTGTSPRHVDYRVHAEIIGPDEADPERETQHGRCSSGNRRETMIRARYLRRLARDAYDAKRAEFEAEREVRRAEAD